MDLEQVLNRAVDRIRSGQLNNEDQVKLSVILPILRALEWDDTNPSELVPEFSIPSGRVDYALFDAAEAPLSLLKPSGLVMLTKVALNRFLDTLQTAAFHFSS